MLTIVSYSTFPLFFCHSICRWMLRCWCGMCFFDLSFSQYSWKALLEFHFCAVGLLLPSIVVHNLGAVVAIDEWQSLFSLKWNYNRENHGGRIDLNWISGKGWRDICACAMSVLAHPSLISIAYWVPIFLAPTTNTPIVLVG